MNVRRSIARTTVAAMVTALSLGLTSCGFDSPTDQVYNPAVGVNDQSSEVDVLNAVIVSGAEGSGTLVASLANNNQDEDDALTDIAASGGDQAQVSLPGSTDLGAGELFNLLDEGGAPVEGDAVAPGAFVTLTFVFERSEAVTVDVPVVEHGEGPYEDVPVS